MAYISKSYALVKRYICMTTSIALSNSIRTMCSIMSRRNRTYVDKYITHSNSTRVNYFKY